MMTWFLCFFSALYLGVLTSISPCPMATNIAAITYIGRKVEHPRSVLWAGILYTLGRCLLYLVLAAVLSFSALSIPAVSVFLQKYIHLVLGPVFLLLGIFLAGIISVTAGGSVMSESIQKKIDLLGIWGAFFLGVLFAVSFCPTSAAWFFGLIALITGGSSGAVAAVLENVGIALTNEAMPGAIFLLPIVYGIGTALPVLFIVFLLAYSTQHVSKAYHVIGKTEYWARMITGWTFVIIGTWFSLKYLFYVTIF